MAPTKAGRAKPPSAEQQAAKKLANATARKKKAESAAKAAISESEESEDLDAMEARIKADQKKLAARKAAKEPPSRRSILEAKMAALMAELDDEPLEVNTTVKPALTSSPAAGDKGKKRKARPVSTPSEDEFDEGASSDSAGSIDEGMPNPGKKLDRASILISYRKILKSLPERDQEPLRMTLRLLKKATIEEKSPEGQVVLEGFVEELQTTVLTSKYGKTVAASVRRLASSDESGGQINGKYLRQALAEQKAMAEFSSPTSGNDPAALHRRGHDPKVKPSKKDRATKKDKEWANVHKKDTDKNPKGRGQGPCYTCGGPHMSRDCPKAFQPKKEG